VERAHDKLRELSGAAGAAMMEILKGISDELVIGRRASLSGSPDARDTMRRWS
jgi:hypothetical protein